MQPKNDRRLAGLIEKRFLIFRHFGRFWSQILTLVMVKPGLIVKRLARKIHVRSPCHANAIYRLS